MIVEIDQSGKVEDTSRPTAVAFANGKKGGSILILAREKRKLQRFFREIGEPKLFAYKVFAVLIFLIIQDHLKNIDRIVIDAEYPGHEYVIKQVLLRLIRRRHPRFDAAIIIFRQIGRKSAAHNLAWLTFQKKQKASQQVTAKDILGTLIG